MSDQIYRDPTDEERKQDTKFLVNLIFEIKNYAKTAGQKPDDTLRAVAEWILNLLEISTFNEEGKT